VLRGEENSSLRKPCKIVSLEVVEEGGNPFLALSLEISRDMGACSLIVSKSDERWPPSLKRITFCGQRWTKGFA
jgi:hypothetical protein